MQCKKCEGNRYIVVDGQRKDCPCLEKRRIKQYLSKIGRTNGKPREELQKIFSEIEEEFLSKHIYLELDTRYDPIKLNSIIAYLVYLHIYPRSYNYFTLGEIRELYMQREWKNTQFNVDCLIISPNRPEDCNEQQWMETSYKDIFGEIIRNRIRKNEDLWVVARKLQFDNIENLLENSFNHIDLEQLVKDKRGGLPA